MGSMIGWLLSVTLAFFIGVNVNRDKPADSELQQKVQDHMDVIVDESAAIIDDVTDEIRSSDYVQDAEKFADDIKEIAQNTADDIEAHFGTKEEAVTEAEEAISEAEEALTEAEEAPAESD
ncbi:MAG: hypothetical protein IJI24_04180 [Lachnospiraceae bacterium]|nr:hypothetical protein [Lachnospiraceae bacterium]